MQIINGRVAENHQARLDQPTCSVTAAEEPHKSEDAREAAQLESMVLGGLEARAVPRASTPSWAALAWHWQSSLM